MFSNMNRIDATLKVIKEQKQLHGKITLIDIGCVGAKNKRYGHPLWTHGLICNALEKEDKIIGIDLNAEAVKKIPWIYRNHIKIADAQDFHLGKKVKVITGLEVIEHCDNPLGFLQCSKEHLKDDGILIITTPNLYSALSIWRSIVHPRLRLPYNEFGHVCGFTPSLLERSCRRVGMKGNANLVAPIPANTNFATKLFHRITPALWQHSIFCVAKLDGVCK